MELVQLLIGTLFLIITVAATLLLMLGFFPIFSGQAELVARQTPGRAFLVGLVNLFFLGTITVTLAALAQNVAEIFFIPGLFFLTLLILGILFGLPGLVLLLGERLWPQRSGTRRHAASALVLILASLTPIVGWFALLPVLLIEALGLAVMTAVGRLQQTRPIDQGREADGK